MRVRVPASSANLGPGFDVLAAALDLHVQVDVRRTGTFAVHSSLPFPNDEGNLVVRAFETVAAADSCEFWIESEIPLCGGLGGSAAAVVGGLLAAQRLSGATVDVFASATAMEGHPDNVGAALLGGIVICDGPRAVRIDTPDGIDAVLVAPRQAVSTHRARAALPAEVPLADACFNVSATARLIAGLMRGELDLISSGLVDRLHQPYRAELYPRSAALLAGARGLGALGATISGAGPTVLMWTARADTGDVVTRLASEVAGWADVMVTGFEAAGAQVSALD